MFPPNREYVLYILIHANFTAQPTKGNWATLRNELFESQPGWKFLERKLDPSETNLHDPKFSHGVGEELRWVMIKLDIPKHVASEIKAHFDYASLDEIEDKIQTQLQNEIQAAAKIALGLGDAQAAKITIPQVEGSRVSNDGEWATLKGRVATYLQNNAAVWYAD